MRGGERRDKPRRATVSAALQGDDEARLRTRRKASRSSGRRRESGVGGNGEGARCSGEPAVEVVTSRSSG
jgi:hypothetical protein